MDHSLDVYKNAKAFPTLQKTEYGIYWLASANVFSEYITRKDIFGNELSEKKRNSSLTEALFVLGVGYVSIKGVDGISKDATNFVADGKELRKGLNEQVSKAFDGLSIGNGPHFATAGAPPVRSNTFGVMDQVETNGVTFQKAEDVKGVSVGTKGTGNTVNDYIDDIIVNGNVDVTKMNKLKNAIQNIDELSELRKKMSELGITKEYDEALIKMDFGKYLRGLIGDPPIAMIDPHAHHILFKKGLGEAQQKLVQEGQEILRKYDIDPVIGKENLVWAPNRVAGQHSIAALKNVVNQLKAVDAAGADLDDIIEILEDLGKQVASRRWR
ncbi:AHH domain-containing protein [Virgibacillus sp. SK37]|uniref:AHH domain-containing protein n=1 Tax=Virgibacillus sp. SK37 TaxID=403957 RepID=UPI000A590BDE|nr:AHH domain-containing protein [Virgibacillus sp. SK37]